MASSVEVTEASLKGKWNVFIFMPAAFTFNCPTEIEDAAENYSAFRKAGAEVYIVTTDTFLAQALARDIACRGQSQVTLIGDPTHKLTRALACTLKKTAWPRAVPL
jgi:peroxiredoxin (alkyl hydroperoxide reductase subunit C)